MQFDRLRRRNVLTLIGGATAWPLAARAQQAAMPMLGILNGASFNEQFYAPLFAQFRLGLKELGFVEGQSITIEYRAANGHPERLPKLTADLVQRQAAVILAIGGSNTALVAKTATSTIPIVFAVGGDAVANGLVRSLNKPEANVTGMSFNNAQLAPKRLDLLRELVPHAKLFGYLDNVVTASDVVRKELVERARSIGREVIGFYASTEQPPSEELNQLHVALLQIPARTGRIGIFNRSYYEEFLVVRVHPELLARQKLPPQLVGKRIWDKRLGDIAHFEDYATRQGTKILKFFLHVSHKEQKKRFIQRCDEPEKNWKFSPSDVQERKFWDDYMHAFEEAIDRRNGVEARAVVRRAGRQQVVQPAPRLRGYRGGNGEPGSSRSSTQREESARGRAGGAVSQAVI